MLKSFLMGSTIILFSVMLAGAVALAFFVGRLLEKAFHETEEAAHTHQTNVPIITNNEIGTLQDKLKKTTLKLEDAQAQLINAEKMASIGQLAAGVAHEINNPLSYVTTNLQLMQNYAAKLSTMLPDTEPIKKDIAETVNESLEGVGRIKNIVNSLVMFSQSQTDQQQYCDINELIENTTTLLWHEIKHKCDLVKDLAPMPQTLVYAKLLNHAFFNVIQNACQAITEKGKITITTRIVDNFIVTTVTDTGIGIAQENIEKIFDPFFKVNPESKNIGIGLSVAYSIIKRHNGIIAIASKLGQGTTVTIKLPVNQDSTQKRNN